jgi:tetrapyrrole methylase family protein/MazG family protein
MDDVCREVCEKLVFRHPNIFVSSAAENQGINGWDALKNKEKGRRTLADELDTVPAVLPALMRIQKMQKRAANYGFVPDAEQARQKLDAACADWQTASQNAKEDPVEAERAAGELLAAAAASMRLAGVDAEQALTFAAQRLRSELLESAE